MQQLYILYHTLRDKFYNKKDVISLLFMFLNIIDVFFLQWLFFSTDYSSTRCNFDNDKLINSWVSHPRVWKEANLVCLQS